MQKREKVLMVTASGTLLLFAVNQFLCTASPKPSTAAPKVVTPSTSLMSTADQSKSKRGNAAAGTERSPRLLRAGDKPLVRFSEWRRDPFRGANHFLTTAGGATDDSSAVRLNGIAWKGDEALALIGEAILRTGESAGNLQVLAIRKDRVLCRVDGETVTFMLKTGDENDSKN